MHSLNALDQHKILKEAQSGNLKPLEALKTENPDFHWSFLKYEKTGDTILHVAARLGDISLINYLLSYAPIGVNVKNNDDKTPLHEACQFSQYETVDLLLKHGAEVNALKRGDWTPLMLSCTKNCLKTVSLLLKYGALVNCKNKDGWNSLHLAGRQGNCDIFKLLLNFGAEYTKTKNGRTPLHIAALHQNLGIINLMSIRDINEKDNCGNTALHEAVLGKSIEICDFLIDQGADINCKNKADFNLLHLASSKGDCDLITYILEKLKFDINWQNSIGLTALHCAARKNQVVAYNFLIKKGANREIRDNFERTASEYFQILPP